MLLQNKSVSPFFLEIANPNFLYINFRAAMEDKIFHFIFSLLPLKYFFFLLQTIPLLNECSYERSSFLSNSRYLICPRCSLLISALWKSGKPRKFCAYWLCSGFLKIYFSLHTLSWWVRVEIWIHRVSFTWGQNICFEQKNLSNPCVTKYISNISLSRNVSSLLPLYTRMFDISSLFL